MNELVALQYTSHSFLSRWGAWVCHTTVFRDNP